MTLPRFKKQLTLFLVVAGILSSCSIQKRHYRPGYFIQWKNKISTVKTVAPEIQTAKTHDVVCVDSILPAPKMVETESVQQSSPLELVQTITSYNKSKKQFARAYQTITKRSSEPIAKKQGPVEGDDDGVDRIVRITFAVILLLLTITWGSVYALKGRGNEFRINLFLWCAFVLIFMIGFVVSMSTLNISALLLGVIVGGVFYVFAFIHALSVLIRY